MPAPVRLTPGFGLYEASSRALGDTAIVYTRTFEIRDRLIPVERFNEYRTFMTDVVKADRAQAVLVRK